MDIRIKLNDDIDLKWLIVEQGYTLAGFAKNLGIDRSTIYKIANNKRHPSVQLASKIEKKLNKKHHSIFSVERVSKSTN